MNSNEENKGSLNKNFKEPKLRFPEFKDEWVCTIGSKLFSIGMCKRIYSNQTNEIGEIPFYKIGTLGFKADSFISKELFTFLKSKYKYPSKKEVLISCSGTIGRCIQFTGENSYFQDSNIVWLINDEKNIINDFLYFVIYRYDWSFLNTTTIKRLFTKDINNLKIIFPKSHNEQFKISNFLSLVDSKINILNNKISLLKKYKDGVCNKFFSSKSNSYIFLSKLVTNYPSQLLTKNINSNFGPYPVYDATGKIYKCIDFYQQTTDCISIIKYGSGCGRTFISKGKHSILGTMCDLKVNNQEDLILIYGFTCSNIFKKTTKKYIEIGTTPNLYYSDFSKTLVPIFSKKRNESFILGFKNLVILEEILNKELNILKKIKKTLLGLLFI